jgi:quercetin 2,3-dioxygenase
MLGRRGIVAVATSLSLPKIVVPDLRADGEPVVPRRERTLTSAPYRTPARGPALAGRGTVGADRARFASGPMATLGRGDTVVAEAALSQEKRRPSLGVLMLGGPPIGEPVAHYGPFVMNTRSELVQALEDIQKGRMGTIPAEHMAD